MAERLKDVYDRMRVTTKSPDRTVTVIMTGNGKVSVELDPQVRRLHTAQSLQKQLNAVARVAVTAFRQAHTQAQSRVLDQTPDTP
ncbi:YbaB/EbfC family nucleoid-associated protein [Catenuloplanes sp. NPDC051500]|uniref:YbaB/EbfC family nucleoid-associated protein n=1 Tax=Catenuloplanes sp. NPDC051500 TaxID=3363959 RepID=UPI0037A72F67